MTQRALFLKTSLTGGTTDALDGIAGNARGITSDDTNIGIQENDIALTITGDQIYIHEYQSGVSPWTESSPDIVIPDVAGVSGYAFVLQGAFLRKSVFNEDVSITGILSTLSDDSSQIIWGDEINNQANANVIGYGAGLKFKNSGSGEPHKWSGVAGVAESSYSNQTSLVFYTNIGSTETPTEKMRISGTGHTTISGDISIGNSDLLNIITSVNGTGGGNREFQTFGSATSTGFVGSDPSDQGYGYFQLPIIKGGIYKVSSTMSVTNGNSLSFITSSGLNFATQTVQTIKTNPVSDVEYTFVATDDAAYIGIGFTRTSGTMTATVSNFSCAGSTIISEDSTVTIPCNEVGYNVADTALRVGEDATTSRSINASGTITTSGADYAEYETKNLTCGAIKKGDIIGFDNNGLLTDEFSKSISFGVKSTRPCIVGGDIWGSEKIFKAQNTEYEKERQRVDRIAYCGKCPINIDSGDVGDYIIPIDDFGKIKGQAISKKDITFKEMGIAIGQIRSISHNKYIIKIL